MKCENQVLLKGDDARKVVDETADTRIILRDGVVVKSHRVVLSFNSFLYQLINSSWVGGDNSTFLMPEHSVEDLLLTFSLPLNAVATNGAEVPSYGVEERGESENEPPSSDSAEAKVEESDDHDHDKVEHHPEKDEEVEEAEDILNENSLLSGFEPELKDNISPGFEMKQVETLKKRLQPEPFPPKSPFCKKRKLNGEVKNKKSANDIGGGELDAGQLGDTIQRTFAQTDHAWGSVKSESELHLNNEETETELKKNFSPGLIMFPVKKGKKGMMFTKDDEHEWHLFKLNGSKLKFESDYYHCERYPTQE